MRHHSRILLLALAAQIVCTASAQLPPDFPTMTVVTNYAPAVADGLIFQAVNLPTPGVGYYSMIVGNDGLPVWYRASTNAVWDFKVLPNGYLHYAQQIHALTYTGGGDVTHQILDENYYPVETIGAGNGYVAEGHEFQMLPNGNVLLIGYYLTQVDMSQVVSNGNPAALVSGAVIQELDGQRNVVFQWRFWDHYPFTSQWVNSTAAVISEFHVNCVFEDTDGNLVVSTPDWVKKISRQTGDILWHLGGTENQFTFAGVSQQQGISDFASHDINRLSNGHVLLYNNSKFGQPGSSSSAKEYSLDETNKVATLIWEYLPSPAINGPFQGSAQRLANTNTLIGWGGLPGVTSPACTEVAGSNVVFQMKFDNTNVVSYRSFRFPFPSSTQENAASVNELAQGNSYQFGTTGVGVDVQSGAGGYNILTVTRAPYAPVYPLFQGKAPRALPVRVSLSANAIQTLGADINFDQQSFAFSNPTNLTVYYRPQTGLGLFLPQPTSYNPVTGQLSATVALNAQTGDLGEFIFCYPDLADLALPPILNEVQSYSGPQQFNVVAPRAAAAGSPARVSEQSPVILSWSPKGFARSYQLEISTNADFSNPDVSVGYQTDGFYIWDALLPDTTYYYQVKTVNAGGASDWAAGSFVTTAPFIQVAFPNGGEALKRGKSYYIRWNDNVSDPVNISLYNSAGLVKTLVTNLSSSGAYSWKLGFDVPPSNDYRIAIVSTTNSALSALSPAPFSVVDAPSVPPGSVTRLSDGRVQFTVTIPGASQASVYGSSDLVNWQLLGTLPLVDGTALFTDATAPGFPARFYRVRVP
jgi:hypothetical protein